MIGSAIPIPCDRSSPFTELARSASHDIGAIRVTTVSDGVSRFPLPDDFVVNASKAEVSAVMQAVGIPPGEMELHYNPIVLETADGRALFDTGFGEAAGRKPQATTGLMLRSMAIAGIDPGSIDTVVISHFHPDHVGGLLASDGSPAFPRAKILVPEREWAFWTDAERIRVASGRVAAAFEANRGIFGLLTGRVSQFRWDDEILPGVTALGTPGHTPGHTSFHVRSEGQSLFIQSDVTNNPVLFATHPDWQIFLDMDGPTAATTRRQVYDRLVEEEVLVQGFHFPFPGRGRVERLGGGYKVVAA